MKLVFALILFSACTTSSAGPAPTPATPPATPAPIAESRHMCGTQPACVAPKTCVSYRGFTGATLYSCEIVCGPGGTCPTGLTCMSAPDGPQNVCR